MRDLGSFLLSLWSRVAEEEGSVLVWAPWPDVLEACREALGDRARILPLPRPHRMPDGHRVKAWWVPWAGPRVHHPVPPSPDEPELPEPRAVWEREMQVVRGRMPLRTLRWPPGQVEDLYALVVLLRDRLPEPLVAGWLARFATHPERFQEEAGEYLARFFRDPHHLRTLKEQFPESFVLSPSGWRWEVPDVPRYLKRVEHYPPWVRVEVALHPEHLPVFHARLARYRPHDRLDGSTPWPPEPRGWSVSPRKEPWIWFSGGWAWIPEHWVVSEPRPSVVPVVGGRHAIPGVRGKAPCGHALPPPEEHLERVLRVNGFSLSLGEDPEDLPSLEDVERLRVQVEELPEREVPPPPPLTVAELIRHTPEPALRRLPHLLDTLVEAGILLHPASREIHGEIPFDEVARRLVIRFLGRPVHRSAPEDFPRPGELVPVAPLLPRDLVEIFPRRVDLRELEGIWDRIVRRFMAHHMPPARIREIRIRVTYRRKVLAERVVPVGVVEPGFTLAAPLTLHPFRGGKLVPVRVELVQTVAGLPERLARLAALCPETPLRELLEKIP